MRYLDVVFVQHFMRYLDVVFDEICKNNVEESPSVWDDNPGINQK